MIWKSALGLGVFLIFAGLARIWLHMASGGTLMIEGCMGNSFSIPLQSRIAHCWGCYAVPIGALLLSYGVYHSQTVTAKRALTRT